MNVIALAPVVSFKLGGKSEDWVLIDADAPIEIYNYRWGVRRAYPQYYAHNAYAVTKDKSRKSVAMHRLILGITDRRIDVDHINGNGLDNRRANLRPATRSQNATNGRERTTYRGKPTSSRYRGVCWDKSRKKWAAGIGANGRFYRLGSFGDEVQAAEAYDRAARVHHGEFARLNFPNTHLNGAAA